MVTNKQKHAVRFIIETLRIPFEGNIEEYNDVSMFLNAHFEKAKLLKSQLDEIANYHDKIDYEHWKHMEALAGYYSNGF